jgi:hypothetical protein
MDRFDVGNKLNFPVKPEVTQQTVFCPDDVDGPLVVGQVVLAFKSFVTHVANKCPLAMDSGTVGLKSPVVAENLVTDVASKLLLAIHL